MLGYIGRFLYTATLTFAIIIAVTWLNIKKLFDKIYGSFK